MIHRFIDCHPNKPSRLQDIIIGYHLDKETTDMQCSGLLAEDKRICKLLRSKTVRTSVVQFLWLTY